MLGRIRELLRRSALAIWHVLFPHSAEGAVAAYEKVAGHPRNDYEAMMFEAVSWLQQSNGSPQQALKRYEQAGGYPHSDMDYESFGRVHWWLKHWDRQARQPVALQLPNSYL